MSTSGSIPSSLIGSESPLLVDAAMDPSLVADTGTSDIRDNTLADLDQEDEDLKDQPLYNISRHHGITDGKVAATNNETELERQHLLGYSLSPHDWVALGVLTVVSLAVRGWKIGSPGEVVLDEAHVGHAVNGYLTKTFTFDRHPPLAKLILAGISSLAGYQGDFAFEEIGDPYPHDLPFLYMRATMALMGALCAPMAYVTLKAIGQSTATAVAAATLVAFDNALTAGSRLMTLEAPLMFFTALSFMSWSMFSRQSPRPFSAPWWIWLTMTGIGASGVLSVKANGLLTFLVIGFLSAKDMFNLAGIPSVDGALWAKHFFARNVLLVVLPVMVYLGVFQTHFSLQTHQPSPPSSVTRSARAEYDLDLLSYPMRDTLLSSTLHNKGQGDFSADDDPQDMVWADIVYGSVVRLRSELRPSIFLHSFRQFWPRGSKQQQVTGYEYPDLNTHWIVSKALTVREEKKLGLKEIPDRLRYLKHGEVIKLRHMATRKCLHSHNVRTMGQAKRDRFNEVSAYGPLEMNGDKNDWWVIEAVDGERMQKISRKVDLKVKALETTFRLKHYGVGCYLHVTEDEVPKDLSGGPGRRELACLKSAKLRPSTIWRFTLNDHDYLPMDTKIASYPKISFWQKFIELHRLMWKKPRVFEQPHLSTKTTPPLSWPLGRSKSIVTTWQKTHATRPSKDHTEIQEIQQMSLVANPIVWRTGFLGVIVFLGAHVVLLVRQKRGYVDQEPMRDFRRGLADASTFFTGWAILYLPYLVFFREETNRLTTHHYFPALYCSILLACTVFSSVATSCLAWRPGTRMIFWMTLSVAAMAAFVQLSPLTYGTRITPEKYHALEQRIYPNLHQRPTYLAMHEYTRFHASKENQTTLDESMTTALQVLFSQPLQLTKPPLRRRPPVLEAHYPSKEDVLPMDNIFMTPAQRPPQLWEVNEQKGQPTTYQRQQMQAVFEAMRKEDEEKKRQMEEEMQKGEADRQQDGSGDSQQEERGSSDDEVRGKKVHEEVVAGQEREEEPAAVVLLQEQDVDDVVEQPQKSERSDLQQDSESRFSRSEFAARLEANAARYAMQMFTQGHPYGSLDGGGIPRHAPRDLQGGGGGDLVNNHSPRCPLSFPDRHRVSFGVQMKRTSDYTRARAKELERDAVFREGILQERLRARLAEKRHMN